MEEYPFIHEHNCSRQKLGSVDCLVYVMSFIEQILQGEKLHFLWTDVIHMRLHFTASIFMDGITRGGRTFDEGKKSSDLFLPYFIIYVEMFWLTLDVFTYVDMYLLMSLCLLWFLVLFTYEDLLLFTWVRSYLN